LRRRTKAREYALQILYQIDITNDPCGEVLDRFWQGAKCNPEVRSFATQLVQGTYDNLTEIDAFISRYSENWEIDRMPIIDRNILRFAIYELLYRDDIPPKVTINEAVDLANKFSTQNSGRFVNGILDKIMAYKESSNRSSIIA